jgi:hypothetical protein
MKIWLVTYINIRTGTIHRQWEVAANFQDCLRHFISANPYCLVLNAAAL